MVSEFTSANVETVKLAQLVPFGGTSVKQTNLVKETSDLNNSQKVNAVALYFTKRYIDKSALFIV